MDLDIQPSTDLSSKRKSREANYCSQKLISDSSQSQKLNIKKAIRIGVKKSKKKKYEFGKFGPFKAAKQSKSPNKKLNKIRIMK